MNPPNRSRLNLRLTDLEGVRTSTLPLGELGRDFRRRPDPPRGLRFSQGTIYWDAPARDGNVTHYNIYVDTESNHVARVPSGQNSYTGVSGSRVFVSAVNDLTGRESTKAVLNEVVYPTQGRVGGVRTHREIQAAIDALPRDGGEVYLAAGEWLIGDKITIPADKPGVRLIGSGDGTILKRKQSIETGYGVINVFAENVVIANLCIDGEVTTPTGVTYTAVFDGAGINGDPIHPTLADNTSIRIHGGAKGVLIQNVKITHTGGYSILICTRVPSASDEDISDVIIRDCRFENNRPHLFGNTGDLVYGAWTSGILYRNEGTVNTKKVRNLAVVGNSFRRCNGNCIWGHALGFDTLNEQIEFTGNTGIDLGLDFIMPGNVIGGVVANNSCRRVGYTHTTDVDTPTPKYYIGRYAVAYDTTGYVRNVNYINNAAISVNGGLIDLDGFFEGAVANNSLIATPDPGEAQYTEDQCASYGNAGSVPASKNITKGINLSSTYQNSGSADVAIENNVIRNCGTHAIALGGSRRCIVKGNKIYHRANASEVGIWGSPIVIYGLTNGVSQTMLPADNVVTGNLIDWDMGSANPFSEVNFCVIESDTLTTVLTSPTATIVGPNYCYDNAIIGNNFGEFRKSANSTGSVARSVLPSNDPAGAGKSQAILQREGFGATAATKVYTEESGVVKQRLQIADTNSFLNVSDNGSAGTGGVVTGNRTTAAFNDVVFTSHLVGDGFLAIKKDGAVGSTYSGTNANLLDDTWALLRFSSGGIIEQSVTTSSGSRVWTPLGGGASSGVSPFVLTAVDGVNEGGEIVFTGAGSHSPAAIDLYQNTLRTHSDGLLVRANHGPGVWALYVENGYIESEGGYFTQAVSQEAVKVTGVSGSGAGGVACRQLNIYRADGGATGYDTVIDGSRNGSFLALIAGTITSAGSGTVSAQNGFYTTSVAGNAINVPSGGITASTVSATSSANNAVQASVGGVTATTGYWIGATQVVDSSMNAAFLSVNAGTVVSAGSGTFSAQVGFYTPGTAGNAINVPSGGVTAKDLSATDTVYNAAQAASGGIRAISADVDYISIRGYSTQPTTLSGHVPTLKIWNNSLLSRLEIGVSLYCPGISCEGNSIGGNNFRYWNGSSYENGVTATLNSFPTQLVFKGGVLVGHTP